MSHLVEHFHNRFEVLIGKTSTLRDEAYRLRYQVYCLERGHDAEVAVENCRERDDFDDHATHVIVKDRRCGTHKATARLITAGATRDGLFPIEYDYPDLLAQHSITEDLLPRGHTAEISRFAISKELRARQAPSPSEITNQPMLDTRIRDLPGGAENRRPFVTFGLLLGLIRLGASDDITHCMAVMKPSLLRMLARFGVHFKPIGQPIEYHGLRQPCYTSVADLLANIATVSPDLWQLLACDERARSHQTQRQSRPLRVRLTDESANRYRDDLSNLTIKTATFETGSRRRAS